MSQIRETDAVVGHSAHEVIRRQGRENVFPGLCFTTKIRPRRIPLLPVGLCLYNSDPFLVPKPVTCVAEDGGDALDPGARVCPAFVGRVILHLACRFGSSLLVSEEVSRTHRPLPGPAPSMPMDSALGVQPLCHRREGLEAARVERPAGAYYCGLVTAGAFLLLSFSPTILNFFPDDTS